MDTGSRPPTMEDVAREAGTSRALVSIAYRGVKGVSVETRDHIFAVAERMGYRPNVVASRLASKNTVTIGVFLLDLYNELFADVYEGVRTVISGQNHHLVLAVGTTLGDRDGDAMDDLVGARADAIIAAGLMMPDDAVHKLARSTPIVSTARQVEGIDSAFSDDVAGATLAVEHLAGLGHRRIAHLASIPRQGYTGRREGYVSAIAARDLSPMIADVQYRQESAARAAAEMLDLADPPTAFFANNDVAALGVMDALYAHGLSLGEDVSLVGYDNTPIASLPAISLTSVDLHAEQLGVAAARLALARLGDPASPPVHESMSPELVVRSSTRPPRRS